MIQISSSFIDDKTELPVIAKWSVRPKVALLNHAESPFRWVFLSLFFEI